MNWVRSLASSDGVCQLRWANEKGEATRFATIAFKSHHGRDKPTLSTTSKQTTSKQVLLPDISIAPGVDFSTSLGNVDHSQTMQSHGQIGDRHLSLLGQFVERGP